MLSGFTVFGDASQWRLQRFSTSPTARAILGFTFLVLVSGASQAQRMRPQHVRAANPEPVAAATPAATAHFGCELRPFDGSQGLFCYGPAAIRAAYGVDQLIAHGKDGTGQTIVIIDAYGSPTLEADVAAFDSVFGLPAPPSIQQIYMPGTMPFDNTDPNQLGWAEETSLDVTWSHAIAPNAEIIVVVAATNNDPDILAAQNYAISNHLGHVISESFGQSEYALLQAGAPGLKDLSDNEKSYARAVAAGISVFVSAGDDGAAGADINGNLVPFPVAQYPASSPSVTTVGGTNLFFGTATNADPNGTYQTEVVWNDGYGAGGGGISGTFATPAYQKATLPRSVLKSLGGHRGYPDVSYNAGVVGGVLVHLGFFPSSDDNGFYIFGGTSAGAPQMAAIATISNQLIQEPEGLLNPGIYALGGLGLLKLVSHDVTVGNNSQFGITGYTATPGWDLATGWGTPNRGFALALGIN